MATAGVTTNPAELAKLASTLPPQLLRFFAKHPPPALTSQLRGPAFQYSLSRPPPTPSTVARLGPDGSLSTVKVVSSPEMALNLTPKTYRNPFSPWKNPATGRWVEPAYSLRRQADLVRMAAKHGLEDLLPPSKKSTGVKSRQRAELGLQVRGTGVGRRPKGHWWERTLEARLETRRQAMLGMPRLIKDWKEARRSRGWKKWPSGKAWKPEKVEDPNAKKSGAPPKA